MKVNRYDSGLLHSNMYVVEENEHAIVIDPCKNIEPAKDLIIDYLFITHEHYDHISGVLEWKRATGAPLICSKTCSENIKSSKKNMSRYFDVFCELQSWIPIEELDVKPVEYSCDADEVFEDSKSISWKGHQITLIEMPGHSAGSIGIVIDHTDFFSGDSLFKDFQIELRFPGGSKKKWNEIGKRRLDNLPKGIRVWPGHFDTFIRN